MDVWDKKTYLKRVAHGLCRLTCLTVGLILFSETLYAQSAAAVDQGSNPPADKHSEDFEPSLIRGSNNSSSFKVLWGDRVVVPLTAPAPPELKSSVVALLRRPPSPTFPQEPSPGAAAPTPPSPVAKKKSPLKWILIAGAGGGAAAILMMSKNKADSSPETPPPSGTPSSGPQITIGSPTIGGPQ